MRTKCPVLQNYFCQRTTQAYIPTKFVVNPDKDIIPTKLVVGDPTKLVGTAYNSKSCDEGECTKGKICIWKYSG